jgi:hypothetical protein
MNATLALSRHRRAAHLRWAAADGQGQYSAHMPGNRFNVAQKQHQSLSADA